MKKVTICLMGAAFLMTAFLLANTARGDENTQGKALYQEKCAICHGANGSGNGPAAAAFSKRPADFTSPGFWQGDVDKKITDTVRNGRSPMPAFDLSSEEINAIISYMKQSFSK